MNDTAYDCICSRCIDEPATLLIEHEGFGAPVCKACRDDEDRHEIAAMFSRDEQ
jgi:hypothetical protein